MIARKLLHKFTEGARLTNKFYIQKPGESEHNNVSVLPGIGIGPEVTHAAMRVVEATGAPIKFDVIKNFEFSTQKSIDDLRKNQNILLGNLGEPGQMYVDNIEVYKLLELYVSVVHSYTIPNAPHRHEGVDFVVIRSNMGGEYTGIEHEVYPGVFESIKLMTREEALRTAEYAFEHAFMTGRKKVTCVHKANIMKLVDGLFLSVCREVSERYPQIEFTEMIVDNTSMQLVKNPWEFDVMVMPNLYGSIVTSIAAGLTGGPGITAASYLGRNHKMFGQACRNSGHDIAGLNLANPTAMLNSARNMLNSMNMSRFADLIDVALTNVYEEGKFLTNDIGGKSTTSQFTNRVIQEIEFLDKRK